jgi:hypothetical protein
MLCNKSLSLPIFELRSLVKFIRRILKRRYKGRDHIYTRYVLEIPSRFNPKIAALLDKTFEIDITSSETSTEETLNISMLKKTPTTSPPANQ